MLLLLELDTKILDFSDRYIIVMIDSFDIILSFFFPIATSQTN